VDRQPVDLMSSFGQVLVDDASRELIEFHREVVVLHLAGQNIAQRQMRFVGAENLKMISRNKERCKERKALNVIPMRMREEDGRFDRRGIAGEQFVAEQASAGAAIEHDGPAGRRGQLNARRIAAEAVGARAGRCDGPASSPKAQSHVVL